MKEKPKRLKPKPETLRELFLKSGNLCAFPNCIRLMMNEEGNFIGQVCHIEAAEKGGERFNPNMTNEERRAITNLVLMCYEHHKITNNVKKYSVKKLAKIKQEHEQRFSAPDRAILDKLTDWTTITSPKNVKNLKRFNEALGWNHSSEELKEDITELNEYIGQLQNVPVDVLQFIGEISKRMWLMKDTGVVSDEMDGCGIYISDIKSAFRTSDNFIRNKISQLESYGLGYLDHINTDLGSEPLIRIKNLESGWAIWFDIIEFCDLTNASLETFTENLDFSILDK